MLTEIGRVVTNMICFFLMISYNILFWLRLTSEVGTLLGVTCSRILCLRNWTGSSPLPPGLCPILTLLSRCWAGRFRSLILHGNHGTQVPKPKLFHFENYWMEFPDFLPVVQLHWGIALFANATRTVNAKFRQVRVGLKLWSKELSKLGKLIITVILF